MKYVCEHRLRANAADAESAWSRDTEPERAKGFEEQAQAARAVRVASSPAEITRPVNPDDYYPPGSIRREEQGSPVLKVCVGPSGRPLREPLITDTSGFPDLDAAAIKVAKATGYAAGTENGAALVESCVKFMVKFALNDR